MAFPPTPSNGEQVEEPVGSGQWFEWTPNHIAPGIGAWVSIPPPGGPGPTGDRFQQNLASASTHTVTHNLNQTPVSVQCVEAGSGLTVIPEVAFTSVNAVTLTWSEPVAATVVVRR